MRILLLLFTLVFCGRVFAQLPVTNTSSELYQKIEKLNVLGSVLYVAAHPDDENTALIAYLSNEKLYRTGYLAMTRGDGGQNLIGNEQGIALGLIRTQELLSARRIDGGEQFFTRAFDFGFSKGPEETFDIWEKEKILSDVVWIIRKFRPDVMIARFPTTGEGGHGHHTASAILASAAFDAAGDSTRFPEQLREGVSVWQPRRLLWNTFNFGGVNTIRPGQFTINAGGYNPLLGESYGEIAARSRSQHKSQGFGISASRGVRYEHFMTIKGSKPEKTLFDGVDITWSRIHEGEISKMIDKILDDYSFEAPQSSVAALLQLYSKISAIPDGYWKAQKLKDLKDVIIGCAGLFMEVYSRNQFFTPGNEMNFVFSADNRSGVPVTVEQISFLGSKFNDRINLPSDTTINTSLTVKLPSTTSVSQPYWLKYPKSKGSYTVKNQQLIGKPENDPLQIGIVLDFGDIKIPVELPMQYKFSDPVRGEVYQPVFVVPNVEIESTPDIALSKNRTPVEVDTHIRKNDSSVVIQKIISHFSSDVIKTDNDRYYLRQNNKAEMLDFSAQSGDKVFDKYKVMIQYPHIPDIVYFPPAETRLVGIDVTTFGKKAGYIPGAGDKIPQALEQLGYTVTTLHPGDFTPSGLSDYDVIVTGVRAYNIHEWLNDAYDALMNYVKNGGVLFVQYNTSTSLGPLKARMAPYPFEIVRTRVTDEDAGVTFTSSGNRLMNFPNKITDEDFAGWIQERSLYHASGFSKNYKTLFSMHDKNENPDEGGLIYCNFGKGRFIYTGLVFFRELPAGVPGAYRLFANLIAKPEN